MNFKISFTKNFAHKEIFYKNVLISKIGPLFNWQFCWQRYAFATVDITRRGASGASVLLYMHESNR